MLVCKICGDGATGNNFGVVSCESCKAFFRRNAIKDLTCNFNDNCNIEKLTRKFCQKCRQRKCLESGMRKELIKVETTGKRKCSSSPRTTKCKKTDTKVCPEDKKTPEAHPVTRKEPEASTSSQDNSNASDPQAVFNVRNNDQRNLHNHVNLNEVKPGVEPNPYQFNRAQESPVALSNNINGISSNASVSSTTSSLDSSIHTAAEELSTPAHSPSAFSSSSTLKVSSSLISAAGSTGHFPLASNNPLQPSLSSSVHYSSSGLPTLSQPSGIISNTWNNCSPNRTKDDRPLYSVLSHPMAHGYPHDYGHQRGQRETVNLTDHRTQGFHGGNFGVRNDIYWSQMQNNQVLQNPTGHFYGHCQNLSRKSAEEVYGYLERNVSMKTIIEKAIDTEFGKEERFQVVLNDKEKARINELNIAAKSLDEPFVETEEEVLASFQLEPSLVSVINLTNLAIKRIIKMAKQISSFSRLCQQDQVTLLKGGCLELMLLRSVLTYNPEKNVWQLPGMRPKELSMNVLKQTCIYGINLYEEHQRFVTSFEPEFKNDETIMLLLSGIALFADDRKNLLHKHVVKLERESYYFLLRRYLETKIVGCGATDAYLKLIGKLLHLRQLTESHLQLFNEMDPREIEPLLREIFDLNPAASRP